MHISEHCNTPSTFMRRKGDIWGCECGQMYVLNIIYYYDKIKRWEKFYPKRQEKKKVK